MRPVQTDAAVEPNRDVSKPPWHPLIVREYVVGKACHMQSIILPMMKFHGEHMSMRRNRVMTMSPVTFEATGKSTLVSSHEADVNLVTYIV